MENPKNKTKLALVKHAKGETLEQWHSWCDGLYGAMNELGKDFNVQVFGYCDRPAYIEKDNLVIHLSDHISSLKYWLASFNPKYVFGWGSSYHNWQELDPYNDAIPEKKIFLYGGGPYDNRNVQRKFNIAVVENESDAQFFDNSVVAFGTNTDVFRPLPMNKIFPSFFPAAFAAWKHHELWAESMPKGSLAVGQFIEHERQCYQTCIEHGHAVIPTLPMDTLPFFYNQSDGVCLTSERMGGCQRAALEALACNVPVLAVSNSKAAEFPGVWVCDDDPVLIRETYKTMVDMHKAGEFNLREQFIVGKLDHFAYADKLRKTLL